MNWNSHRRFVLLLRVLLFGLFFLQSAHSFGQASFPITLLWPTDSPTLKFVFGKYQPSGIVNGQGIFVSDVTVENLSDQPIPKSVFTAFVMDKDGVRIGRGLLRLPDIAPKHTERAQLQFSVAGIPVGLKLLSGRTTPMNVVSVPPGANLKVDGQDAGATPKIVDFTIGAHVLELTKEGYAPVNSPLDVGSDDAPGGSVSFELGGLSKDTVQLRDGTVVLGDVLTMSMTAVTVRVEGKDQKYDRNQVRKIILVERVVTEQPPIPQPVPNHHP
jgi:hypothetical protein